MFKLEHPSNLISRMFILEYIRDIGAQALYEKASKQLREKMFYKFIDQEDKEQVDINWEEVLFNMSLSELEIFLTKFTNEVEAVAAKHRDNLSKIAKKIITENVSAQTDINLYDFAKTDLDKIKDKSKLYTC